MVELFETLVKKRFEGVELATEEVRQTKFRNGAAVRVYKARPFIRIFELGIFWKKYRLESKFLPAQKEARRALLYKGEDLPKTEGEEFPTPNLNECIHLYRDICEKTVKEEGDLIGKAFSVVIFKIKANQAIFNDSLAYYEVDSTEYVQ